MFALLASVRASSFPVRFRETDYFPGGACSSPLEDCSSLPIASSAADTVTYLLRVVCELVAVHVPGEPGGRPRADRHAVDVVLAIRAEGRVLAAEDRHTQWPHCNTERERERE